MNVSDECGQIALSFAESESQVERRKSTVCSLSRDLPGFTAARGNGSYPKQTTTRHYDIREARLAATGAFGILALNKPLPSMVPRPREFGRD